MREILFRGKKIDNGEWVYGFLSKSRDVKGKLSYCIDYEEKEVMCSSIVFPETVGQYTGLTDKNGKKIFEGDILRLKRFGNIEWGKIVFNTNVAEFEFWRKVTVGAYGEKATRKENLCAFTAATSYVDIRGNIHDNPELLEGVEK